jgi:hypothetical protein
MNHHHHHQHQLNQWQRNQLSRQTGQSDVNNDGLEHRISAFSFLFSLLFFVILSVYALLFIHSKKSSLEKQKNINILYVCDLNNNKTKSYH